MDLLTAYQTKYGNRFFVGWGLVVVAAIGISTGPGPFAFASFSLFMKSFEAEFGWPRTLVSSALTFLTVLTAISLPFIGRLVDRFGVRRILLPSLAIMGLCLAAIGYITTEFWHILFIFFLIGTIGAGTNSVPYMRGISAWFVRHRGLAMGIAMAGIGLGYAYVPLLVEFMIANFSWRAGWYALSAIVLFVALPLVYFAFRDAPEDVGTTPDGDFDNPSPKAASRDVGLTASEVLRTREFWMLVSIFLVLSFVLNGILPHIYAMQTDRGMDESIATLVQATVGVTVAVGRIVIGFLIDRFFAPYVALFFFSMSALGLLVFAFDTTGSLAFLGAVMIGLSLGAEVDILAYLTGRYFGLKAFGTIYGMFFAAVLFGTAFGPLAFGIAYDLTGSYVSMLLGCVVANVIALVITALLRPYPDWETSGAAKAGA